MKMIVSIFLVFAISVAPITSSGMKSYSTSDATEDVQLVGSCKRCKS